MRKTPINKILREGSAGSKVTACGWVKSRRDSKNLSFVVLNDGSCQDNLQVIVDHGSAAHSMLTDVQTGAALSVQGTLKHSEGKNQSLELLCDELHVFGKADPETYALQKKGHTLEFLRDIGHLRGRTNTFGAIWRLRSMLAFEVHRFFQDRGFYWMHTPIITASDCEGAGEMFTVTTLDFEKLPRTPNGKTDFSQDFFGKRAHLTVSGQLEAEFLALSHGNVYTFGPTFRAENSNTTRHLSEFWMIEPEMAFADLEDDMNLAQDFLRHLCAAAVKHGSAELKFLEQMYKVIKVEEIAALAESQFTRITYTDAVDTLLKSGKSFEFPVKWGIDLQSEHERFLTDEVFKGPVIVTNYPKDIKAFYMRQNDDGKTVAAMDVLAPRIGEIIGGSQREDRLPILEAKLAELQIPTQDLQWYLDLRRYGSCPHAGFGLGFERLVQYLTGMGNIRDTVPCPRAPRTISL